MTTRAVGTWTLMWIIVLNLIGQAQGIDRLPAEDTACMKVCQLLIDIDKASPDLLARPPVILPVQRSPHPIPPAEVEALIRQYFQEEDIAWALRVSYCESRWDTNALNTSSTQASGLFQHLPRYWHDRSEAAGWSGADIFDPVANTAVAAWLYYSGGPSHWVCK